MKTLNELDQFDALMSHLNAEDNDKAFEFRESLRVLIETADDDAKWRSALEAGGVDNWCGYCDSLEEAGYWADKMEDRYE